MTKIERLNKKHWQLSSLGPNLKTFYDFKIKLGIFINIYDRLKIGTIIKKWITWFKTYYLVSSKNHLVGASKTGVNNFS